MHFVTLSILGEPRLEGALPPHYSQEQLWDSVRCESLVRRYNKLNKWTFISSDRARRSKSELHSGPRHIFKRPNLERDAVSLIGIILRAV
jgi:hypothetical protein